ncbi:MAG: hypothetical protein HZB41_00700 [Ignavibacteriae bacterium]|nr:hypothetical protein [Ignavibacteriota bacterium]
MIFFNFNCWNRNRLKSSFCILILSTLFILPVFSQGFTSTFHEKNVGKIIFALSKISLKNPADANPKNYFSASDFIYGRVFTSGSVQSYKVGGQSLSCSNNNILLTYFLYIDGKLIPTNYKTPKATKCVPNAFFTQSMENNNRCNEWNSWRIYLLTGESDKDDIFDASYPEFGGIAGAFKGILGKMSSGEHKIKIEVRPALAGNEDLQGDLIADGEFVLNVKTSDIQNIVTQSPIPENKYKGEDFLKLKEQAMNALKEQAGYAPLDLGFTSDEFTEGRYPETLAWYRKIGVWCAWDDQDGDGLGRISTSILIADQKADGKTWSKLRFLAKDLNGFNYDFPVNLIKNK